MLFVHCVLVIKCVLLRVCRYESAELYWRLFDCGVLVKHLVYNKVGLLVCVRRGGALSQCCCITSTSLPVQAGIVQHY